MRVILRWGCAGLVAAGMWVIALSFYPEGTPAPSDSQWRRATQNQAGGRFAAGLALVAGGALGFLIFSRR